MSFGDELATRWVTERAQVPRVQGCADGLLATRHEGTTMARWPTGQGPQSPAEAYAVQDAVADALAALHRRSVGWKLGCTSTEMQRKLGSDGPIRGHVFDHALVVSGTTITGARPDMYCVEAEFAFVMGADLPPRAALYSRDEVLAAIGSLHPAIEQVESRFADWQGLAIHDIVADNASHGRLVLGEPIADWRSIDLPNCTIRLLTDGKCLVEGQGSAVLGDPVTAMMWLAQHLSQSGRGLRRGEVVTTGTCTGLSFVEPGAAVVVEIAEFGSASTSFRP